MFAAGGQLYRFDPTSLAKIDDRPTTKTSGNGAGVVVLHGPASAASGDAAIDVATAARIVVGAPKGYDCSSSGDAFSADASRVSRNCVAKDEELVIVQDTRTGAVVAKLTEFETAAPVRGGTITDSGNFVFWVARASGAFEQIKSKVTGPGMSSHSTMSPDDAVIFTVPDKNWITEDTTPAKVLDSKNGRARYELPYDVDRVSFSADGARFAAVRVSVDDRRVTAVTLHRTEDGVVIGNIPDREIEILTFSPSGHELVVRGAGTLKLYADIP